MENNKKGILKYAILFVLIVNPLLFLSISYYLYIYNYLGLMIVLQSPDGITYSLFPPWMLTFVFAGLWIKAYIFSYFYQSYDKE